MAASRQKKEILRNSMSVPYCGETRYFYLDDEEVDLIHEAMEEYATQEAIAFANWLSNFQGDFGNLSTQDLFKNFKEETKMVDETK